MTTETEVISGVTGNGIVLISDLLLEMPTHLAQLVLINGLQGKTLFHTLEADTVTLAKGFTAYNVHKHCASIDAKLDVFNFVSDEMYAYFKRTSFVEDLKLTPLTTVNKVNSIVNFVVSAYEPATLISGELNALVSLADVYKVLDVKAKSITVLATQETYTKYIEHLAPLALATEGYNVIVAKDNGTVTMMKLVHRLGLTGIVAHKTLTL